MTEEERAVIVDVLCGLALSDHLGDVRDEEGHLWKLLGVAPLPNNHPAWESESEFRRTRARLTLAGIPLPAHLASDDDDDEDEDD